MRNCLSFCTNLSAFIIQTGIWSILDAFHQFRVVTDILVLNEHLVKTTNVEEMRYAATRNDYGVWTSRTTDFIVLHLTNLISSPGTVDEVTRINTALKCLCINKLGNVTQFYKLISEGYQRRMMYQKLCQIAGPLEDELKTNSEFLITLVNRKLIAMEHLHQLSTFPDRAKKSSHYIIHNINHLERLKIFLFAVQNWCCDRNLIELVEDISFDIEMIELAKIDQKIIYDKSLTICDIY